MFFSPRGPSWTHRWPTLCVGWPALRLHQVTTGTGFYVSRWAILRLGNHEKWGGCRWTRCPRNWVLSHVAQDTAHSWFRGAGARCAVFGAFWRLLGPFLGHIVELEGTKGPLVARKSSRTWSVAAVCLRLAALNPYQGCFGRKMAVFGPKLRSFGRAPPDLAPPPRAATGEFLAQNLDLARPPTT